jgi:hypothetical protein
MLLKHELCSIRYIVCCCAVYRQTTRMPNILQGVPLEILCTTLWSTLLRWEVILPNTTQAITWSSFTPYRLSETACPVCPQLPSKSEDGCATPQAVSCWLPTAAVRVRSNVRSCGISGWQSATRAGFLRVLQCPLPISFHRMLHIHPSSGSGTISQSVADVPSGLCLTPPQEIKKIKSEGRILQPKPEDEPCRGNMVPN